MPTAQEVVTRQKMAGFRKANRGSAKPIYEGPIIYRGEQINWRHSLKRVVHTLRRSLDRSQFASLNIVGIPGSGKTTCAVNIITDLIEEIGKETQEVYTLFWKGAQDLRNLGDVLEDLPKDQNHIVVFDDVSKALERLSGAEQAAVFEQLTTTRHVTGGKLLIVSLYHYTFANLKSIKSQGVIVIYCSCTLTEYGNIQALLNTKKTQKTLRKFARVYESAYDKGTFQLEISKNQTKVFVDGQPFRPCLVVNLFKAHIGLFMKLETAYNPPMQKKQAINTKILISTLRNDETYGIDALLALKILAMIHGHPHAMRIRFVQAFRFVQEFIRDYHVKWNEVEAELQVKGAKRIYRKKGKESQLATSISRASKEFDKMGISDQTIEESKGIDSGLEIMESINNEEKSEI